MTRQHERVVTATVATTEDADGPRALTSPAPGWFRPAVSPGALLGRGATLGELIVLGRAHRVIAPEVHGVAIDRAALYVPRAVAFGELLVAVDASIEGALAPRSSGPADEQASELGVVLRAPTSGRFYGRPSPDKPPFVVAGDELSAGATVCLLEVMKTFHRVTYGGPGLPERARVRAVLIADGDDVTAGAPLLAFE